MLGGIARLASRRGGWLLAGTLALAVAAGVVGAGVTDRLRSSPGANFRDPGSESVRASDLLTRAAGVDPDVGVVALVGSGRAEDVERAARELRAEAALAEVRVLDVPGAARTYVVGSFGEVPDERRGRVAERLRERFAGDPAVELGGPAVAGTQITETIKDDLTRAELIALPLLVLHSFWVFRGLVAALLPPLVGGVTVAGTLLGLRLVAEATDLSVFALNLVTGLGLGLAIDYSLFVVSRFREELDAGRDTPAALERTMLTAGRTVLFSALTVAAALASLAVFPQRFLFSMAVGGVLVALTAAAAALVFLPALLAVLGSRVNALAPRRWQRPPETGFWTRLAGRVMRRPGVVAAASAGLLVALGLPFLGVTFTGVDAGALPRSESARRVADALVADFDPSTVSPTYAVLSGVSREQALAFAARVRALPEAARVPPPARAGPGVWRVDAYSGEGYLADRSRDLAERVRALDAPVAVLVGGASAGFNDQQARLRERLPLALGLLAATTLVLLFLFTGSVLLPVKALVMNILSISAAFGILVIVFQWLGTETGLESTQPVLLCAVAFGLSTDYGVFLLSRIKEAHDAGLPNRQAVAVGLERTGRIVTAAALLFCVAIGSFATSRLVFIQELAIGTGAAVALDATIVRAFLVPSLMALLGDWNWWAPAPLRRLHARLGLAG